MKYVRLPFAILMLILVSCSEETADLDTTPPAAIMDLSVQSTSQGFHLRWTASGDDGSEGKAAEYDIRYASSNLAVGWESAFVFPSPPIPGITGATDSASVLGIGTGPWEFGIKARDEAGNSSALSNVIAASIDTIPPAAITDLTSRGTGQGFYLRWSAPGDDETEGQATQYDIRYATSNLANDWESAFVAAPPLAPAIAGHPDSVSVLGIGWGPWEMGVRTVDEAGNWSALSNIVTTTIPEDTTSPASVTDLAVDLLTEISVEFCWTASGDDGGIGRASEYDLRYALTPITSDTWANATRVLGMSQPLDIGEKESFTVTGLQSGSIYHFALRVLDEIQNESSLSNEVSASVSSPVQLTFSTTSTLSSFDPDWSPGGESIVFTRGQSVWQSYVIPATGGNAIQYTATPYGALDPSWSPDGTRLAISLFVDGESRRVLALMDAQVGAAALVLADHGANWAGQPRWSSDGTRILYTVSTPSIPTTSEIYTIPSTGGVPEHLTGGWPVSGLDWSPEGTVIVYSSPQVGTYDLWVIPSTGGAATRLTAGAGHEWAPAWSPDGSKIAYVSALPSPGHPTEMTLWIISASGENPRQVTFNSPPFRRISWSPDGRSIAYGSLEDGVSNIWTFRVK